LVEADPPGHDVCQALLDFRRTDTKHVLIECHGQRPLADFFGSL
jgi:hypothetical protein